MPKRQTTSGKNKKKKKKEKGKEKKYIKIRTKCVQA
jgi:hypothetical protein